MPQMNNDISVDIVIIGAGTAGISAFKEASKVTQKIILIDHGPLGTTCSRVGCMPSKALIQAANYFHDRIHFAELGISGSNQLKINIPSVMNHVRKLRDHFTFDTIKYLESLGKQFIKGNVEFCDVNVLLVNQKKIKAKNIIIATGTSTKIPNEWQLTDHLILTNENLFEQENFLEKISVIGAGPLGLELGQVLSRLGIRINIFNSHEFIGKISDPVVNDRAIHIFQNEFPLYLNRKAIVEKNENLIHVRSGNDVLVSDQILAALGNRPNFEKLNLEKLGIKFNEKKIPFYDQETLKIDQCPIYLAGDVRGSRPLLHEAYDDGRIAGYNAVREHNHHFIRQTPLMITFTQPNIAVIGKSFKDLQNQEIIIGEVNFENQGRAKIMLKNSGVLRIYADKKGKLLGSEMIAPAGEHLAHMIAFAIQQNMTVFDFLKTPFYHPTVEEGMRTALKNLAKQASTSPH